MNIGSRLKQILAERGMTVSQLSRESGVPAQTLYAMINRDSNKADMDIMAKMLMALDMDLMEFLGLEARPRKRSKPGKATARMQNSKKVSEETEAEAGDEPGTVSEKTAAETPDAEMLPEEPAETPDAEILPEEEVEEPAPRSYRRDLEDYLL